MFKRIGNAYKALGQKIGAFKVAPSNGQIQLMLFVVGVTLLSAGIIHGAHAQAEDPGVFTDARIAGALNRLLALLEGSFGALVMVGAGIGAILSSAFGQYRAALGCLIVAVGAFILRSMMSTFFNTQSLDNVEQ